MAQQIYQWVVEFLNTNQFASGGLALGLLTAMFVWTTCSNIYLREIPQTTENCDHEN